MSLKTGRIYKIVCGLSNDVYVGSTFNELKHRFQGHKDSYKRWKLKKTNSKVSAFDLFDKYDIKNFKIMLIKEYQVCDKHHLSVYEQLWINKTKCVNINSAFAIDY